MSQFEEVFANLLTIMVFMLVLVCPGMFIMWLIPQPFGFLGAWILAAWAAYKFWQFAVNTMKG